MAGFKNFFLEKFEPEILAGSIKSILDLGSGLSLNFLPLLEKYPELIYVGIEPSKHHAEIAKVNLKDFKNAKVINADGYATQEGWGSFDLVISLSVLEHVKQIDKFIENSVSAARGGGQVVHSWDLGHALYPSSVKERFQVWLGNQLPMLLPESKFVRKLMPHEVSKLMSHHGVRIEKLSYHQMPDHKALFKSLPSLPNEVKREIIEWEFEVSKYLENLEELSRLKLFPTVSIWARKN